MIIKNGRVMDPSCGRDECIDIRIKDGRIQEYGHLEEHEDWTDVEIVDAANCIVAPGLVDVHVHFRDPGYTDKEDILTGAKAAVTGGYTSVVCMANTKPINDNEETLNYVLEQGRKSGVHLYSTCAISKKFEGEELTDMEALHKLGAVGFTDDGMPLKDARFVYQAMKEAKRLGVTLSMHEEDPDWITEPGVNLGKISSQVGYGNASSLSENLMVARDCMLALHTGARVNIQHVSSKESVEEIRHAKNQGADIWAEVTPQHFSLTEEAVLKKGTLARVNPPLRTEEDRMALIAGLQDGTIDMIATDHAPHTTKEKNQELAYAPSGMIGLETALSLGITNLVYPGYLTMMDLLSKMSMIPASMYELPAGSIQVGQIADLVIIDSNASYKVENFASKANNSPFIGELLYGQVKWTIVEGQVSYEKLIN